MIISPLSSNAEVVPVFIGTYTENATQGIEMAQFDTQTGELKNLSIAAPTANPTFLALHPNGRYLYAANEGGKVADAEIGGLSAFEVNPEIDSKVDAKNVALKPINAVASGGGLCHVSVDATGKFLLAAAYSGGSIEVWALLETGAIGERVAFIKYPTEISADGKPNESNGHQFILSPDNRFAFAVDLGLDKVFTYHFDAQTGALPPADPPFVALTAGAGPRHLAFNADASFAYVISEHGNTITVLQHSAGVLQARQTISTLPAGFAETNYAAEIAISPNGKFLYASNRGGSERGRDSIAIFSIDAKNGTLQSIGDAPTEGRNPRHFTFSPDGKWLLAANQNSRSIIVFRVDSETGQLSKNSLLENVAGLPVCLLFAARSTPAPQ